MDTALEQLNRLCLDSQQLPHANSMGHNISFKTHTWREADCDLVLSHSNLLHNIFAPHITRANVLINSQLGWIRIDNTLPDGLVLSKVPRIGRTFIYLAKSWPSQLSIAYCVWWWKAGEWFRIAPGEDTRFWLKLESHIMAELSRPNYIWNPHTYWNVKCEDYLVAGWLVWENDKIDVGKVDSSVVLVGEWKWAEKENLMYLLDHQDWQEEFILPLTEHVSKGNGEILDDERAKMDLLDRLRSLSEEGFGGASLEVQSKIEQAVMICSMDSEIRRHFGIRRPKGILLWGPPGTGKTSLARIISQLIKSASFKLVKGPELCSKWFGETESNIREIFSESIADWNRLGKKSPIHVIAIDEIDAVLPRRGTDGISDRTVNQFLTMIDGFDKMDNVILIGMTNRLDRLDEASIRPGRFDYVIKLDVPADWNAVREIIDVHLKPITHFTDFTGDQLLEWLQGKYPEGTVTGAIIESIIQHAVSECMRNSRYRPDVEQTKLKLENFEHLL